MGSGQGADAAVSTVLRVNGRYATERTLRATLDAVAAVALAAAGGDTTRAQSVRKWEFDKAQRAANASLPAAETIRQRLGLTSAQVLLAALKPLERRRLALAHDPDWQLGSMGAGRIWRCKPCERSRCGWVMVCRSRRCCTTKRRA